MLFYELSRSSTRKQAVALSVWSLILLWPNQIAWSQTSTAPRKVPSTPEQPTVTQPAQTAPVQTAPTQNTPAAQNASPAPSSNDDADKNAAAKPSSGTEGIPAIVVDSTQARGILGTQVRSSAGEDMGRIVDVIVSKQAQARGVVIDFGGFLGVGNRQIAVAWSAIRFSPQDNNETLTVDFTRDQLRAAPAYKSGEQIVLLGPPGNNANAAAAAPASPSAPAVLPAPPPAPAPPPPSTPSPATAPAAPPASQNAPAKKPPPK